MPYLVKLEHFEGPLDLLLQLIEKEYLSITEISLAQVTDDYLKIVRSAKEIQPDELADFLVIAAKLILIKSQMLLPGLEIEREEGSSLEDQLRLYREFLDASKKVENMLKQKRFMFGRERVVVEKVPIFSPPFGLRAEDLSLVFRKILKGVELIKKIPKAVIERTISIQEKIDHIRGLVLNRVALKFGEILKNTKSKTEVIISFLALLELVKQRIVDVKQESIFNEITLQKNV